MDPQARCQEHPGGLRQLESPLPWKGGEENEECYERERDAEDVRDEWSGGVRHGGQGGAVDGLLGAKGSQRMRKMMKGLEGWRMKKERRVKSPGVCLQLLTPHLRHCPSAEKGEKCL